jgi:hypothetical protein
MQLVAVATGVRVISLVGGLVVLVAMVELLRRRQLREKYAALWLVVAVVVLVLGIFPRLFDDLAHAVGVANPPDLLLFIASLVLLLVCVHLSWEIGRLEDRARVLAEELALLKHEVRQRQTHLP